MREELGKSGSGFRLWSIHARAFAALVAGRTQWRRGLAMADTGLVNRVFGLDYAGLEVALGRLGLELAPHEWGQLGVLEQAAAAAMNGDPMPEGR